VNEPVAQPEYRPELEDAFERLGAPTDEFAGSLTTAGVAFFLGVLGLLAGVGGTLFMI
jgi:hypothetical protein